MAPKEKSPQVLTNSPISLYSVHQKPVGRRELLKALAIGGSAAAMSPLLPNTWIQPVIETVLLPDHAQTSTLTIENLHVEGPISNVQSAEMFDIFGRSVANVNGTGNNIISYVYQASFTYNDPLGQVNGNTLLHLLESYHPSNSLIGDTASLTAIGANISGDGFSGAIEDYFSVFYGAFQPGCGIMPICQGDSTSDTAVTLSFSLKTVDGRQSNSLNGTRPRPAG